MISVTILVKNGQRRIKQVLESVKELDEVILLDTGSTDATVEIASHFSNVVIHRTDFKGFGPAHNTAAALAKNDWILSIDADEILSKELLKEILSLSLNSKCVYALRFHNFFNERHIKWCGWHPESHIRLYNKKMTRFSEALVHEGVLSGRLEQLCLHHPIYHYPYDTLSDFLQKMERYSSLFAEQYQSKRKSSPWIAIYHGMGAFLKSYLLKRGFLGGYEGFLISIYNGHTAFYKYLKLFQANVNCANVSQNRNR